MLCCFALLMITSARGQCSAAQLQSVTYDTLVPGTGNATHVFTLTQFDPSIGTLVSAKINSVVSVNYGFTLQNVQAMPIDFSVSVGRYDSFDGSSLSSPYSNLLSIDLGDFPLNPGQSVSRSLYNILYRYVNTDSFSTGMLNFLGTGSVSFNYKPITYTTLTGSNTYFYSATAGDTVDFSITYYYCSAIPLASVLNDFSAVRQSPETVGLSWTIPNEQAGRTYEIEKSLDGEHFSSAGNVVSRQTSLPSTSYQFPYQIQTGENRLMYFRLKITTAGGQSAYSGKREVDMSGAADGGPYLFPNPSPQFVNIFFGPGASGNWRVDLLSVDGRQLQTSNFSGLATARIDFSQPLAQGIYFVRAAESGSRVQYVLKLLVR